MYESKNDPLLPKTHFNKRLLMACLVCAVSDWLDRLDWRPGPFTV